MNCLTLDRLKYRIRSSRHLSEAALRRLDSWDGYIRGGGPTGQTQSAMNAQSSIIPLELGAAESALGGAGGALGTGQTLLQPLIQQQEALASGNRSAAVSAAMPVISQLSQGYNAAAQAIKNQLPPGAAQDEALANLQRQQFTGIAGAQAQMVEQAPQVLAGIGAGESSLGIQELGAALSGFGGAGNIAGQVAQEGNAAQQNKLGFIGSLAGLAGNAAAGFNFGGGSGASSPGTFQTPEQWMAGLTLPTPPSISSVPGSVPGGTAPSWLGGG